MKRKLFLFGVVIGALTLSTVAVISTANQNNNKVNAVTISGGQLYVQVRDASEFKIGDTVIFGADQRLFTSLAGNPIFSYGEQVNGHNEDFTKYYFASSNAIPWKVEQGVSNDTYSFRSIKDKNLEKDLAHPTNGRYLAYGHNYSGPGYSNIQAYGDINTSGSKNDNSSWTVEFGNDSLCHMQRRGEPYRWSENAEVFTEIQYRYYGSTARNNFGYYQNGSNLVMYRKVDFTRGVSITVDNHNDKEYTFGERTDLTGLEITVTLDGNLEYTCTYENEPDFFEALPVSLTSGAYFKWCGFEGNYNATVEHDTSDEHRYSKSNDRFYDPRGEYVLAFDFVDMDEEDVPGQRYCTRVMNVSSLTTTSQYIGYQTLWEIEDPIIDTNYPLNDAGQKRPAVVNNLVKVVMIDNDNDDDSDDYYIQVGNKYLFNDVGGKLKVGDLTGEWSHDQTAAINFDSNNHITFGYGMGILAFDKSDKKIKVVDVNYEFDVNTHIAVEAYHLQLTDNLPLVDTFGGFLDYFFEQTAAYDPTGLNDGVTSQNWSNIKDRYDNLDLNLQGFLGCLTYRHNHESGRTVYQLVDTYDSILNIHGGEQGFTDFMSRGKARTLASDRNVTLNGTHCEVSGYPNARFKDQYVASIINLDEHYANPDFVQVLMGGVSLDEGSYTYDKNAGTVTIHTNVVVDDIVINVEAVSAKYTVTYLPGDGSGENYVVGNLVNGDTHSLVAFEDTSLIPPAGQRFKCWQIQGEDGEYQPGDDYDISGNVIVTAVYETVHAVDEIENHTSTTPYLYYDYEYDGENYTFSNILIRFRGIISETLWDELNGVNDNILGFGALLSTESYLNGVDLKTFYSSAATDENVKNFYVEGTPTFLEADLYDEIDVDSYSWNLRKAVGVTPDKLTRTYVALTYVLTKDFGPVFLSEAKTSVKDLAASMMATGNYEQTYRDGSLKYLSEVVA